MDLLEFTEEAVLMVQSFTDRLKESRSGCYILSLQVIFVMSFIAHMSSVIEWNYHVECVVHKKT